VRLVFLCAVPATEATTYLQVISRLARAAKERGGLQRLLEAEGAAGMWEALRQIPLRPAPPCAA
jgi:mannitol/fructose-specific phosphotransferase system IIA component (Ntr-type)